MSGGRLVRLPGLVVPPPGEALLALPASLGAALHVTLADLVLDQIGPGHPGHREPALADEQDAPRGREVRRRGEGGGIRQAVVLPVEG